MPIKLNLDTPQDNRPPTSKQRTKTPNMKFAQALSATLLLAGLSPSQSVGAYPKPASLADSGSVLASAVSETACVTTLEYSYDSGLTDSAFTTVTTDNADAEYLQLDLTGTVLGDGALLTLQAGRTSQTLTAQSLADDLFFSAQFSALSISVTLSTVSGKEGIRGGRNLQDGSSMVKINGLKLGGVCGDGAVASICGATDDRVVSNDQRQGRIGGCTGWLISEDVFVQAGHCGTPGAGTRIHFVETSGSADPEDQYAVEAGSYTGVNGGVGNDWGVGRLLPNSITGLKAGIAQGDWYSLGNVPTTPASNNIRITGYGSAATLNRYQKTHTGALVGIAATSLSYVPDTTGGNSGSPVVHVETGDAIGVHTHGGCSANGGSNSGTRIDKPEFAAAINMLLSGQTPPPSPAPTNSPPCTVPGFSNIQVEILTDNYPGETTWSLTDTSSNLVVMERGDVYQSSNTLYTKSTGCLSDTQYRFLIEDSFGDGICCSYGSGSYKVTSDGVTKAEGGAFTSSETTTFNSGDITPTTPPPTPTPTPSPTPAPTPSPTPAPSTSSPTFFTCSKFNEIECPTAHEGQCQWLGNCHNCGCVPQPRS